MPDRIHSSHDSAVQAELAWYHLRGLRCPWEKVYRGGRDVTDDDPSTWPWPWSMYYAEGWRPWQPE